MLTGPLSGHCLLYLYLLLLLVLLTQPSQDISDKLFSLFNSFIDSDIIVKAYEHKTFRQHIDTHELGRYVGEVTGAEFNEAFLALKNIRDTGQKSYEKHKWDRNMNNHYWDGFTHPLASTNGSLLNLTYMDRYGTNVSLSESAINLPIDVYDNWTDVRNTIQWTNGLNKAFVKNYGKKADNIFWQYIGTPQGVMRTYPATYIPAKDQVNFDVRKRPWYNAGIGCPKDMILLIDTSGSLEGFPSRLLKTTASKLIQLILADTDFVTAIDVGHTARFLTCFRHLMRANKSVKKIMQDAIDGIQPNGTSNWTAGFELAFKTFNTSRKINQSAFCEQAIVLFSDETGQPVDEIVRALNHNKKVRVYVFSFKKNEGLYNDKLKQLACANRGYYSKILYFGQIESALQRLVQIGNSPLKGKEIAPTWSNAYIDLAGFGLVITVTLPIVVATSETERIATGVANNNSVSLLGIVGLDFKSSRIVQISNSIMPVSSTSVIINNKGYPIYHPRVDKYEYLDVNTKFHNFQFTDENFDDLVKLETAMIDRNHNLIISKGFLNVEGQMRGSEWYQELTYQIFPVDNTPFSIACIYSTYPPTYLMYNLKTLNIEDINNVLDLWSKKGLLTNFQDNSCNIKDIIERKRGPYSLQGNDICSSVIFSMFTDIYLAKDFESVFKFPAKEPIRSHFIMLYNGLVFFSNPKWNSDTAINMGTLTPYAKTTKNITAASLFVSIPFRREGINFRTVNITQRVNVSVSGVSSQVAAVGVELAVKYVRIKLLGGYNDKVERFLVDENGMILMGHPTDVSGYLGVKYSALMVELIKKNIFQVINYTECINQCRESVSDNDHDMSTAFRPLLYNILTSILNIIANLKLVFFFDYFSIYSDANHIVKEREVECCKMFNHYQRNFEFQSDSTYINTIQCNNCPALYEISSVPDTNLLMVADYKPECLPCAGQINSPARGVRVKHNQGCLTENSAHGDEEGYEGPTENEAAEEELFHTHYYKSFKSCIISYDDEGICSSSAIRNTHFSSHLTIISSVLIIILNVNI